MKLRALRQDPSASALAVFLFAAGFAALPYLWLGEFFYADELRATLFGMLILRTFSAALAVICMKEMGFFALFFPRGRARSRMAALFAALVVCVNNLPIIALARGTAGVSAPAGTVVLFVFECLSVAAFEETAFRGIVFPLLCETFGEWRRGRFAAAILSSVLFGALHLLNLFSGGNAGATLLQAGYSALIGGMLCAVMFAGGSIFSCIALHAVYNVCGLLVPTVGFGGMWEVWNAPTIALTAVIGACATAFFVLFVWRMKGENARALFYLPPHIRFAVRCGL